MIYRKVIRRGPMPLFGRQLFRGQLAPLILANNTGVSPEQYAAAYDVATPIDHDTAPVVIPPAPANIEPCPFSNDEEWACENIDPDFPFCKKRPLAKSDPACTQAGNMECGITETVKKICTSNPRDPKYAAFCDLKKHSGKCLDEFIAEEKSKQEIDKSEQKEEKHCITINFPGGTQTYCPIPVYMRSTLADAKQKFSFKEWYLP